MRRSVGAPEAGAPAESKGWPRRAVAGRSEPRHPAVVKAVRTSLAAAAILALAAVCSSPERGSPSAGDGLADPVRLPRIWDDRELAGWATPVAGLGVPPALFTEEEYYAAPVDNLRTYPVY